jgi:Holliday junction resolvase RusA-like endonuclease
VSRKNMCKFCKDKKQLVENQTQARRQVASDLAKKLKLEEPFAKDVRRLLNTIIADYEIFYSTTGQVPSLQPYRDDLTAILRTHYRKTSKEFKNNITGELEQTDEVNKLQLAVSAAMANYIAQQSTQQAQLINRTTQNDIDNITRKVMIDAALEGERLENNEVASQVKRDFKAQIPGKADTIAMTEVNNISENAKQTEASILAVSGLVIAGTAVAGLMKKTWHTVLDSKTRTAHARADGQTVEINQPFFVGGEALRYPSDSRGSAGNTINCRCSVTYGLRR